MSWPRPIAPAIALSDQRDNFRFMIPPWAKRLAIGGYERGGKRMHGNVRRTPGTRGFCQFVQVQKCKTVISCGGQPPRGRRLTMLRFSIVAASLLVLAEPQPTFAQQPTA